MLHNVCQQQQILQLGKMYFNAKLYLDEARASEKAV